MRCPALVLALSILAPSLPLAGQTSPPASVDALLDKATAAVQKQDYDAALKLHNQAVELDPENLKARMRRIGFLGMIQGAGGNEEANRWIEETLREDLRTASRLAPDSREGGIARDALAQLEGRKLFPEPSASCSEAAAAAMGQAEQLLMADKPRESLPHYRKAVELCPGHPVYWVHYADVHYVLGELQEAARLFEKGIALAPWYGPGHRFLADTLAKSDPERGYHEAVLAVLSDPTYEAGWATLKDFTLGLNGTWLRAYGEKPRVAEGAKDGLNIILPAPGEKKDPDDVAWMMYALGKAAAMLPQTPDGSGKPQAAPARTPLEREKQAVLTVLQDRRERGEKTSFWDMMGRAERAGFLEEAIYVHLLDEDLLPGYLELREKGRDRLVRYVETVLAPLPPKP